ncbi:hypothetical protein [Streptomyces ureilyticus]|uniref:hypothetical protein n=1 Tax=Streptomyces ureilyticus TaxID=1775131 RepID=UPI001F1EE497|nr:hypothetical protein [Streptomyces ureilyticus]
MHSAPWPTLLVVTHDPLVSGQVRRTVRIRDGRTSTETLRTPDGTDAEEYTVLGRTGRLRLPTRLRGTLRTARPGPA